MEENNYTKLQKEFYLKGTTNHDIHNQNSDYWDILLKDLKNKNFWENKTALDFACGKGRNVKNMFSLCRFKKVDGIDISYNNIEFCKNNYKNQNSDWYCNNGIDVSPLKDNEYDFIMSTIALQHIPVYDIRKSLLIDIFRTLKNNGIFSFQMGYGKDLLDKHDRPKSSYYENSYDASGTNAEHDVRIQDENEIINDLKKIGYKNVSFTIKDSFSDDGHPYWIYLRCEK